MAFQPVIIIGAPRSGTNMLRDILTSFRGVATWPCDEINYIWRHGNARYPSDELPVEKANKNVQKYLQKAFMKISEEFDATIIVEKTCANSLRVPYVDALVPDAKYIFIVRDGIDATGSAKERWNAKIDISYVLKKIKYVPLIDIPFYAIRYIMSRTFSVFWGVRKVAIWGPVFNDMQSVLKRFSLSEACAIQWQQCVDRAEEAFEAMPTAKVYQIKYESFVLNPATELAGILRFLNYEADADAVLEAVKHVSLNSLGKGRAAISVEECGRLESLIGNTLKRYEYL